MKKNVLNTLTKTVSVFLLAVAAVSCGGDDSAPVIPGTGGDISIATGTFKGKITVYPAEGSSTEYFDAEVTVTKISDNQLKVTPKAGEPYSVASAKTFQVDYSSAGGDNIYVTAVTGSPEGHFIYNHSNKSLNTLTEQQTASEVIFAFEGTKQ